MLSENERTQTIFVHDSYFIQDDGKQIETVSLNTRGHTKNRMELTDAVNRIVNIDNLSSFVGKDIGKVTFTENGNIKSVELYDEIIKKFGHE